MIKTIFFSIGKIFGLLFITIIIAIVIYKLVPALVNSPQPAIPNNAYPPPADTPTPTYTTVPYPPPGKMENSTPTVTIMPPLKTVPPPPNWPTVLPWPPPRTTPTFSVDIATVFPTPVYPATPIGKAPADLQKLWYAYAPNSIVPPLLQMVQIDSMAQRWGNGSITIDLGL